LRRTPSKGGNPEQKPDFPVLRFLLSIVEAKFPISGLRFAFARIAHVESLIGAVACLLFSPMDAVGDLHASKSRRNLCILQLSEIVSGIS
jgi:hypothetical protein